MRTRRTHKIKTLCERIEPAYMKVSIEIDMSGADTESEDIVLFLVRAGADLNSIVQTRDDRGDKITVFAESSEAERIASLLTEAYGDSGIELRLCTVDNADKWFDMLEPFDFVEGFRVVPARTGSQGAAGRRDILLVSRHVFGMGDHPTTKMIAEMIIEHKEGVKSFLDAGCGTGLLCVWAAKHGIEKVTGIDIDPGAVACAKQNISLNGVPDVTIEECSLEDFTSGSRYDMMVFNLPLPVIKGGLNRAKDMLADNGKILVSGILSGDIEREALSVPEGYRIAEKRRSGEWAAAVITENI